MNLAFAPFRLVKSDTVLWTATSEPMGNSLLQYGSAFLRCVRTSSGLSLGEEPSFRKCAVELKMGTEDM